ncbi:MAG: hypothetical protein KY445_14740 [Armatimonadetes bacterium]|nr:hypothetical protein [Armatimonadota bacterium]
MKNRGDGARNSKSALLGCGCLLSPFLLLFVLVFGTTLYNNFRLWNFERNFAAISHPPQTKFIARTKEVGLFGNGNHCDFLVAEVRSFIGSPNAVRNFYKSTRIAVPNDLDDGSQGVQDGTQPVEIVLLPSPLPKNYRWKYHINEIDLSSTAGQKDLYVVLIANYGESYSWDSMCDFRCT